MCGSQDDKTHIVHNLIEYLPHHGINLSGNKVGQNLVEYNKIRYVCQENADNGAINSGGPYNPGHTIQFNYFTDVYGCEVIGGKVGPSSYMPTSGVYLDCFTST